MEQTGRSAPGAPPRVAAPEDVPVVGPRAAQAYVEAADPMVARVNRSLNEHPDLERLLGGNSFALFEDNHRNHVRFVAEMLATGQIEGLFASLPWVYRAYLGRGVDPEYFPIELDAWIEAIRAEVGPVAEEPDTDELIALYESMQGRHDDLLRLAHEEAPYRRDATSPWSGQAEVFAAQLRDRDHRACLAMCRTAIAHGATQAEVFQHIVYPAMVEIGECWETGEITVADEHMSTAIVNNVLVNLAAEAPAPQEAGGVAVLAAPAAEHHEIGLWMVSACLEAVGWDVVYLGSDLPPDDIADACRRHSADLVALSVAMPFNVGALRRTVEAIRRSPGPQPAIAVGGGAFTRYPGLVETVDADVFLSDAPMIAEFARGLSRAASSSRS